VSWLYRFDLWIYIRGEQNKGHNKMNNLKKRKDNEGNTYLYDTKNNIVKKYNSNGILVHTKYSNGHTVKY